MNIQTRKFENKKDMYEHVLSLIPEVFGVGDEVISRLANACSLIGLFLEDINWAGFYLMKDGELTLGPFQGKPAVTRIRPGEGVCGTVVLEMAPRRVDDVRACSNHIVCDPSSSSEIVIPMIRDGLLIGVLDIDSPTPSRFDDEDEKGLLNFINAAVEIIFRTEPNASP
jgi:GAF domain-containing protein